MAQRWLNRDELTLAVSYSSPVGELACRRLDLLPVTTLQSASFLGLLGYWDARRMFDVAAITGVAVGQVCE